MQMGNSLLRSRTSYSPLNLVLALLSLLSLALIMNSCTSNPIGEDEISFGKRELKGEVRLANNSNPEGVFVWLEGFDFDTTTDADGRFSFVLPPPAEQPGGGLSGGFMLYFYMANYELDSVAVFVQNGEFLYSTGDINSAGELVLPRHLVQILNIRSSMFPESVRRDETISVIAKFQFSTLRSDTALVYMPGVVKGFLNPILFHNRDTGEILIFSSTHAGLPVGDTLKVTNDGPVELIRVVTAATQDFPVGSYEAVPFLFVLQDGIPRELANNIRVDMRALSPDYLDIPFVRQHGLMTVLAAEAPN